MLIHLILIILVIDRLYSFFKVEETQRARKIKNLHRVMKSMIFKAKVYVD